MKLVALLRKELRQEMLVSLDELLHEVRRTSGGKSERPSTQAYRIHTAL
jgi:hypothetical protein